MNLYGPAVVLRGDARTLPLPDGCVDLIVTSPPYFGLRSYTDGGQHYEGQVGDEATPTEYLDALTACTAEWVRVLKPGGSIFVNLGDKYSQRTQTRRSSHQPGIFPGKFEEFSETWAERAAKGAVRMPHHNVTDAGSGAYVPEKSLIGLPWRYALRCVDELGLILRAEIIWSKPNGLPESVTDRVRRAHEQVFHFVKQPRYFAAVDDVREEYAPASVKAYARGGLVTSVGDGYHPSKSNGGKMRVDGDEDLWRGNPLGRLPGSVWEIPTAPLVVPEALGVDHFAAYPPELVRRIVLGWSPRQVCTACGEGQRPVVHRATTGRNNNYMLGAHVGKLDAAAWRAVKAADPDRITGYACACGEFSGSFPEPETTPGVVLDPFGGTGTTALVASTFGRIGITVDLSADYCRLARWRTTDPGARARVLDVPKPAPPVMGQLGLFDGFDGFGA